MLFMSHRKHIMAPLLRATVNVVGKGEIAVCCENHTKHPNAIC
jgi:hypothetical protein